MGLGAVLFVILGVLGRGWSLQWQEERDSKKHWDQQVANLEAGKTTGIIWPEPRFLEGFVRDQPDVAAKVTQVQFTIGKVSDERYGYLRQLPHLEAIDFYEIREGADSLLSKIAGMESITNLAFIKTRLAEDGVHAVASFPNLKRLHIDHLWEETSLEPLRGHKRLEELVLEEMPITKEWIAIFASLPKLREIDLQGSHTQAQTVDLQKALPNVKILGGK